jgi:antitoxin component YwqK of YwqJK toxin-antitoxin module
MVGAQERLTDGGGAGWRALAAVAALLLAAGADASAQPYVVAGSCRDGAPNGAYELAMPDGRLRIVGAFAKGRRTGTFLFWSASGARIAVIPYEDDAKIGTVALWYPPAIPRDAPRRKLESAYAAGVLHGYTRSWHANGKPRAEYRYERGALAAALAWSESGEPLPEPEARRLAERDRGTEAEFYASLERMIAENTPHCD